MVLLTISSFSWTVASHQPHGSFRIGRDGSVLVAVTRARKSSTNIWPSIIRKLLCRDHTKYKHSATTQVDDVEYDPSGFQNRTFTSTTNTTMLIKSESSLRYVLECIERLEIESDM